MQRQLDRYTVLGLKLTDGLDLEGEEAIINKDVAAGLHHLGDVLVVQPQVFLITVVLVFVVQGQLDGVALLEFDLLGATLKDRGPVRLLAYGQT